MPLFRLFIKILKWALLILTVYEIYCFSFVVWWKYQNPIQTAFMQRQLNELQKTAPQTRLKYQWVDYDQISIHLKRAIIAAEDGKFLHHHGFDLQGIQHAFHKNMQRGRVAAGGSTITQQLAKNLFLSPAKNGFRKIQEALLTLMIEATWSKKRILEVYLNSVEWGAALYGAQAASKQYYGLSAQYLNAAQAAQLAVRLPNPKGYQKKVPLHAQRYAQRVLQRMPSTAVP